MCNWGERVTGWAVGRVHMRALGRVAMPGRATEFGMPLLGRTSHLRRPFRDKGYIWVAVVTSYLCSNPVRKYRYPSTGTRGQETRISKARKTSGLMTGAESMQCLSCQYVQVGKETLSHWQTCDRL